MYGFFCISRRNLLYEISRISFYVIEISLCFWLDRDNSFFHETTSIESWCGVLFDNFSSLSIKCCYNLYELFCFTTKCNCSKSFMHKVLICFRVCFILSWVIPLKSLTVRPKNCKLTFFYYETVFVLQQYAVST